MRAAHVRCRLIGAGMQCERRLVSEPLGRSVYRSKEPERAGRWPSMTMHELDITGTLAPARCVGNVCTFPAHHRSDHLQPRGWSIACGGQLHDAAANAHDTRLGVRCGACGSTIVRNGSKVVAWVAWQIGSVPGKGVFRTSAIAGGACSRLIAGQPEGVLGYGQIAGGSRCVSMRQTARSHQSASPGNRPAAGEGRLSGKAPCLATHSTSIEAITRSSQRSTRELYRSHRSCIQHQPELIAIVPCRPLLPPRCSGRQTGSAVGPTQLAHVSEVQTRCRSATRSQVLIQSC